MYSIITTDRLSWHCERPLPYNFYKSGTDTPAKTREHSFRCKYSKEGQRIKRTKGGSFNLGRVDLSYEGAALQTWRDFTRGFRCVSKG